MNRKQFLKNCAGGLCCCFATGGLAAAATAAETNSPATNSPGNSASANSAETWRSRFVRRRYARLLGILSAQMDEKTLNETLLELGRYCATTDPKLESCRGNFDGYCEHLKHTWGDEVTYDREKGVITVTSPERTDCFCPFIGVRYNTPKVVCNCSLGWQQHTWETILGKPVKVELVESVLRGGKRCIFKIQVLEQSPGGDKLETHDAEGAPTGP